MFALLDFWDFMIVACIVSIFATGSAYAAFSTRDRVRLGRLERKVDLILRHLNIEYVPGNLLSEEVRQLALDPAKKISAIKLHREQTGVGLKEAKEAVEEFMAGGR